MWSNFVPKITNPIICLPLQEWICIKYRIFIRFEFEKGKSLKISTWSFELCFMCIQYITMFKHILVFGERCLNQWEVCELVLQDDKLLVKGIFWREKQNKKLFLLKGYENNSIFHLWFVISNVFMTFFVNFGISLLLYLRFIFAFHIRGPLSEILPQILNRNVHFYMMSPLSLAILMKKSNIWVFEMFRLKCCNFSLYSI